MNELRHYGIPGMKWGVRRYQNYDGTYTKRGLARYNKAHESHLNAKSEYEEARNLHKEGKTSASSVRKARNKYRATGKAENQAYKNLKWAKTRDQGKELAAKNVTVVGNRIKTAAAFPALGIAGRVLGSMASNALSKKGAEFVFSFGNIPAGPLVDLGIQTSARAIAVGYAFAKEVQNRKLRAFYNG